MDLTNPQIIMRDKEIAQLRAENARLNTTLLRQRQQLEDYALANIQDRQDLALQPCTEVLNKVRAEAAMATIEWVWSKGSVIPREAYSYVKRIEQGEAG